MKKTYFKLFDKDLGIVLDSELGKVFKTLIFTYPQGIEEEHDEGFSQKKRRRKLPRLFIRWARVNLVPTRKGFSRLFLHQKHLRKLNLVYAEKFGFTLIKLLETELRGDLQDAAMYMLVMKFIFRIYIVSSIALLSPKPSILLNSSSVLPLLLFG